MALKKKLDEFVEKIIDAKLEDIVGERFGSYSKYIIQERALPDVRDGLKPVQRRILYAMYKLGMFSNTPFRKSARITGEVMGKYHPHGDTSIYDAMVRMSQTWKMRIPLITMHGNNGSMDGDSPAAMRYTEARLSKNAEYMLQDIDKKTVLFTPNFDDEELEPTVLPSKFPNILVNGATGISAGYATNIPPHNLNEVISAAIYKIDHPNMSIDDLMTMMKGPDFPTGGIVQGIDAIKECFEKGQGKVVVRAKTIFEDISKDQKRLVILEIPYEVNKQDLVRKIDQLRIDGKVDGVLEVRDESDREGLRISIDLKKQANADALLNYLFKNTDLQKTYSYNMVAIYNHRPMVMSVLEILDAYIVHQKEVLTNRCNFELLKAQKRLHIVSGLIKMVSIVDKIIKTIRESKNKADAKENIMKNYSFSELQAEAIVTLQLYRLSNTDIVELENEKNELTEKIERLTIILNDERELLKEIKHELKAIMKTIPNERKTVIEDKIEEIKIDETALITNEKTMISVTRDGYVKRSNLRSVLQSKTNGIKENDSILLQEEASTLDTLLLFTERGSFIYYPIYKLTETKWSSVGTYIGNIVTMDAGNDKIIKAFIIDDFNKEMSILLASKNGLLKQTRLQDYVLQRYTKSSRCFRMDDKDRLVSCDMINEPLEVIATSKNSETLRLRAQEIPYYGLQAGGVKTISIKPKDELIGAFYANLNDDMLLATSKGHLKRIKISDLNLLKRGRVGQTLIKLVKTNPQYVQAIAKMTPNQYSEDVEINVIFEKGNNFITAFNIKYNDNNTAQVASKDDLGLITGLILKAPLKADKHVNPDYLLEEDITLFNKTEKNKNKEINKDILSDLDAILEKENSNTKPYKKISLFDDVD